MDWRGAAEQLASLFDVERRMAGQRIAVPFDQVPRQAVFAE
jgi:hypothetical protein